jgi:hypothetical protein
MLIKLASSGQGARYNQYRCVRLNPERSGRIWGGGSILSTSSRDNGPLTVDVILFTHAVR